jgi:hypothetical protein
MSAFWQAGSTVGPRYLIPVLPFFCLPVIHVLDAGRSRPARWAVYGLFVLSGILIWLETVANGGYPAQKYLDPLAQFSVPGFLHDHVAMNLGSAVLGSMVGFTSRASLLLLPVLLAFWTWFALRRREEKPHPVSAQSALVQ